MDKLADYYARRASEYERIYAKPERQADLAVLRTRIGKLSAGKNILELACGTGYWTEIMAVGAARVTAIDVNEEVLQVARTKSYPENRPSAGTTGRSTTTPLNCATSDAL